MQIEGRDYFYLFKRARVNPFSSRMINYDPLTELTSEKLSRVGLTAL